MCSALVNSIQGQMISSTRKEYIKSCQPEGSKSRWYVIRRTKRSFKEEILLISQLKFSSWHFTNFCVSPKTFSKLAKFTSKIGKTGVMQNLHSSFMKWANWADQAWEGQLFSQVSVVWAIFVSIICEYVMYM